MRVYLGVMPCHGQRRKVMKNNDRIQGCGRWLVLLSLFVAAPLGATELYLLNYGQPSILGQQGNRDATMSRFSISDDGRYVVFATASNNQSVDDVGNRADIFLSDSQTGEVVRVSRRGDGGEPDGDSMNAVISGDGRWVFYLSVATDIVQPASTGLHLYRFDRTSGLTQRLSATPASLVYELAPSYDGSRVAFTSDLKLVASDNDERADVYLWRQDSTAYTRLSVDSAGAPLPCFVDEDSVALSADGLSASFVTRPLDSVSNECGIFVRDLAQSVTDRVANAPVGPMRVYTSLSADARLVAFDTREAVLPGDGNASPDVYVFDRSTRVAQLISVTASGMAGNGESTDAVLSRDGRYVVFNSTATNLAGSATGRQVFRRDRFSGTTMRIAAAHTDPWLDAPAFSGDGRRVVLASEESLAADDDNRRVDVYAIDADGAQRISKTHEAARIAGATTPAQQIRDAGGAFVLSDGGSVVYASGADALGPSRRPALFRFDRRSGSRMDFPLDALAPFPPYPTYLMLAGASLNGSRYLVRREPLHLGAGWGLPPPSTPWDLWRVSASGAARLDDPAAVGTDAVTLQAMLSDDGRYAVFVSMRSPDGQSPGVPRLFLHDADTNLLKRIDVNAQDQPANLPIQRRTGLSRNGRYAALVTAANNLVANDADNSMDLFLRDNVSGTIERLRDPQTKAQLVSQARGDAEAIVISDDGQRIVFTDAAGPATVPFTRLRVLDRAAGNLFTIAGDEGYAVFRQLTMSADGGVLAFVVSAPLLPVDTDSSEDVYSYRFSDGSLRLESVDGDGAQGSGPRRWPRLSADGDTLTFQAIGAGWRTTPLISGDSDWLFKSLEEGIFADGFDLPAN